MLHEPKCRFCGQINSFCDFHNFVDDKIVGKVSEDLERYTLILTGNIPL